MAMSMSDDRASTPGSLEKSDEKLDDDHPHSASSADSPTATPAPPTTNGNDDGMADIERDAGLPPDEIPGGPPVKESPEERAAFLVKWDAGERSNPRNWSTAYKGWITLQLGMLALSASLGSSITAPAFPEIAQDVGISEEVVVLTISLYVLGFAFGPLLWAPISEVYGRRISILPALVGLSLFSVGTAVSRNAAAVLLTRFFGGIFGSAPVSNVAAALGDLYEPKARGIAVTFYAVCVVGGPTIGPVIGSALTSNPHFGWRWTEYIEAIWTFSFTVLSFFFMPELYAPVLLKRKACRLRKETGDPRYWHPHERAKISPSNILTKHLSRPLRMFVTEPMVTCIAVYASFVFALLYMTLEMFPMVYGREHIVPTYGFGPVVSTLPFLGLFVGVLGAMGVNLANQPRYSRIVAANKGRAVPEARLPPMLIGGVFFAGGIFWFGWTANPKYNWAIPTVATAFIGAGFNIIFQQCINFLVDTYALYAASAVSANTFLRSIFASGLPLAVRPMFARLGVGPSCSILGAVACTALPVPLLFMRYGASLRRRSKFAPAED